MNYASFSEKNTVEKCQKVVRVKVVRTDAGERETKMASGSLFSRKTCKNMPRYVLFVESREFECRFQRCWVMRE